MQQHYRGEVVYNQEDDVHEPVLTVAQTILFALKTKVSLPVATLRAASHASSAEPRKEASQRIYERLQQPRPRRPFEDAGDQPYGANEGRVRLRPRHLWRRAEASLDRGDGGFLARLSKLGS